MKKNRKLNIVFAGTPEFSVPFLEALIKEENIRAVITRPDRPAGRKRITTPPPVKVLAEKSGIRVLQPEDINSLGAVRLIKETYPDIIVTVSYGGILKRQVLEIPGSGCLNIHPSLLPRYRGPCPIEWALIKGERTTGVCCILMDEGTDSGDIIGREEVKVTLSDTKATLEKKLVDKGIDILRDSIGKIKEGGYSPRRQEGKPVYAPLIRKKDTVINWENSALQIHNLIRALYPGPGARTFAPEAGKNIIIWESSLPQGREGKTGRPGIISETGPDRVLVNAGEGSIYVKTVQPESGRKQNIADFLRGRRITRLG